MADWEVTQALANALGYPMHYDIRVGDHGRDRRADADLRRRLVRHPRRARQRAVAVQRGGTRGHADHARGRVRARQGHVRAHRLRADRGAGQPQVPAAADHRAASSASTTSAPRPGAPRTSSWLEEDVLEIHPADAELRGVHERRPGVGAEPHGRDDAAGARSPSASRRASSTPRSTIPRPAPTW